MATTINYSDGPIDEVEIVADFLLLPEELVFREETVKVTIALSRARSLSEMYPPMGKCVRWS
ncbi:MAG: hypothetical protein M9918_22305 [Anaerolineae bacterium]|nr:hypothetical protein [Anaerolineae bacterium]